ARPRPEAFAVTAVYPSWPRYEGAALLAKRPQIQDCIIRRCQSGWCRAEPLADREPINTKADNDHHAGERAARTLIEFIELVARCFEPDDEEEQADAGGHGETSQPQERQTRLPASELSRAAIRQPSGEAWR